MAKSLRSKIKRKHAIVRREKIYKPIEDERTLRLAERLGSKLETEPKENEGSSQELSKEQALELVKEDIKRRSLKSQKIAQKLKQKKMQKRMEKERLIAEGVDIEQMEQLNDGKSQSSRKGKKKGTLKNKLKW